MKKTLGIIGAGAFGALAASHLAPHFDIVIHDVDGARALAVANENGARTGLLSETASCEVILLAAPVQRLSEVLTAIAPLVRPDALVMDVGSVKLKPAAAMLDILPVHVAAVGTHPLFGPQSAKDGISGLKIAICELRGGRGPDVARFCRHRLGLEVLEVTPDEHDRELAYVHGLTHMLGKVIVSLDLPKFRLTTKTYELIDEAVGFIRHDTDELFAAIERENPHAAGAKRDFFAAARSLEARLENRLVDDESPAGSRL